jgi:hypothetical protein
MFTLYTLVHACTCSDHSVKACLLLKISIVKCAVSGLEPKTFMLLVANINECEFVNNLRGEKHEKWAFEVKDHLKLQKRERRVELGRQGLAKVMDVHTL